MSDKPRKWVIAERRVPPLRKPLAVEDHGDGTFTAWSYGMFGPIGSGGKLKDDVIIREPANKAERQMVARAEAMMERSLRSQRALVESMRGRS